MGIFAIAIFAVLGWTLLRWLALQLLQGPEDPPEENEGVPPIDPDSPYAPPRSPLLRPAASPAPEPNAELQNRMGHALEDLGQNLPLGAQAAWRFGPPPPAAVLEPEEGANRVSLSAEELEQLSQRSR